MVCKRVFISGKVQGVSFRYHTFEMAAKLNLKGYVRNLPDGRVEILVYGSEGDVGVLIQWSRMGQPPAHVVSVEVMDVTTDFPKEKFHIRRESS